MNGTESPLEEGCDTSSLTGFEGEKPAISNVCNKETNLLIFKRQDTILFWKTQES